MKREEEMWALVCAHCGKRFDRPARKERYRRNQGRATGPFCSKSCVGKAAKPRLSKDAAARRKPEWRLGCARCGKTFTRRHTKKPRRAYCSRSCAALNALATRHGDAVDRFMSSWTVGAVPVVPQPLPGVAGPCWDWARGTNSSGHAYITVDGTRVGAHRYAFEVYHDRPVVEGAVVHHRCLNPSCVYPLHLEEMSVAEHVTLHKKTTTP